ncbi:replication initiation negative regulator SeqA [Shewanella psychrotolerans]|uniref:replication initiation negative regulator SeqA n=1 Tax=Shewanella psychrotolerans TaxID=2864206 RepID=UPI001C6601E1|nr:replication initiation negative regulator SeqA [Shewanella psychrotolerans]QYJ99820.1 replication initiation negative regulator SeqA [Shewanella psychrotolerans]
MKYIEIDEELYRHIASKTERIGESASEILRRLLGLDVKTIPVKTPKQISEPSLENKQTSTTTRPEVAISVNSIETLIDKELLAQQKGAVGRFLYSLEAIYNAMPQQFDQVLQIQGRDRLYFATSKESLLKASKSANPKEIGNSGFWVTTNNNTAKKRTILTEVLLQFGVSEAQIESIISNI